MTLPHLLAALLGCALSRRVPNYRRVPVALAWLLALDLAAQALRLARGDVDARLAAYVAGGEVPPYVGAARAAWAVEQVLRAGWYAVRAGAVWQVLAARGVVKRGSTTGRGGGDLKDETPAGRRPGGLCCAPASRSPRMSAGPLGWGSVARIRAISAGLRTLLAFAALASSLVLFALYPLVRGRPAELAAVALFVAALAAQLVAATRYILRWRAPDAAQAVALVLVCGALADAAGPWIVGQPVRDWYAGGPSGAAMWGVVAAIEAVALAKSTGPRK